MENWGFLIEGGLFGGAALAWGFWELWSLRRDKRKTQQEQDAKQNSLSTGPSGHAEGQHGAHER